jgi:hypothetical protein
MNLLSKSVLGAAVVALITTNSAQAQILNGDLETTTPISGVFNGTAEYTGSPYADQTLTGFGYNSNVVGNGEPFKGFLTDANNYQIYQTPSAGYTGNFAGPTVIQVNSNGVKNYTLETLAPLIPIIRVNTRYTLTFALANDGGGAGSVTLSLFSATSAVDTTNYSIAPYGNDPATSMPYPATSPLPVITTGTIYATGTNSGINTQAFEFFTNYSISFDTFNGDNAGAIGQNLYAGLNVTGNGSLQFDNAQFEVIPEPSTWALMFGGLAFLGYSLRRRATRA